MFAYLIIKFKTSVKLESKCVRGKVCKEVFFEYS